MSHLLENNILLGLMQATLCSLGSTLAPNKESMQHAVAKSHIGTIFPLKATLFFFWITHATIFSASNKPAYTAVLKYRDMHATTDMHYACIWDLCGGDPKYSCVHTP